MLRAFFLIVAVATGGLSAWLVAAKDSDAPATTMAIEPAPIAMEEVLVAVRDIERGAQVVPADFDWQSWPAEAVTPAFILRSARPDAPTELDRAVARGNLVTGEPIVAVKLAPPGSSMLSAVLSSGMRAVAVAISAEQTAGGFILPDDRVDVVLRQPCRANEACSGTNARTLLRNVRVLAIDQSGASTDSSGTLVGKTATLELTPKQAETVVGAGGLGTLSLVLRSAADHGDAQELVQETKPEEVRTVRILRSGSSETVAVE